MGNLTLIEMSVAQTSTPTPLASVTQAPPDLLQTLQTFAAESQVAATWLAVSVGVVTILLAVFNVSFFVFEYISRTRRERTLKDELDFTIKTQIAELQRQTAKDVQQKFDDSIEEMINLTIQDRVRESEIFYNKTGARLQLAHGFKSCLRLFNTSVEQRRRRLKSTASSRSSVGSTC